MADAKIRFDVESQKALEALVKQNRELVKTNRELQKVSRSGREAGKGMGTLTGRLPALLTMGGAIATILRGLRAIDQQAKGAAEKFQTTFEARQALVSVATSAADRAQLVRLAETLSAREGLGFAKAAQLVFAGRSAGFTGQEIRDIAPIAAISPDVEFALTAIKQITTQFGRREAGTPIEVLNKVLAGAKRSPVTAQEFVPAIITAAGAVKGLGGTEEELIAAGVVASFGGPVERQVTQIRALATELSQKPEFEGKGLSGALDLLTERFVKGGEVDKIAVNRFFSNVRARAGGLLLLENREQFAKELGLTQAAGAATGTSRSAFRQAQFFAQTDPQLTILRGRRRQEAFAEQASELEALRETIEQSALTRARGVLAQRVGQGQIGRGNQLAALLALPLADVLNRAPGQAIIDIATIATATGATPSGRNREQREAIREEFIESFGDSVAAFREATRSLQSAATGIADNFGTPRPIDPNSHTE